MGKLPRFLMSVELQVMFFYKQSSLPALKIGAVAVVQKEQVMLQQCPGYGTFLQKESVVKDVVKICSYQRL